MTRKDAIKLASSLGFSLRYSPEYEEYRLARKGQTPKQQEAQAYYTPWLEDAIGTMHEWHKQLNPPQVVAYEYQFAYHCMYFYFQCLLATKDLSYADKVINYSAQSLSAPYADFPCNINP